MNDEGAEGVAPGEVIDTTTGLTTKAGDRTAVAADGYLWEPALYINGSSTAHFPTQIRGSYNSSYTYSSKSHTLALNKGAGVLVSGMEPPPAGTSLTESYTTENIWDVSSLGLAAGTYHATFVVHDGDHDRAVGCVTIVIQ
jgi:hypothetical protein